MIGIVAGVGPYAGLDLLNKILNQTRAVKDQDHLTIASLSQPAKIVDRTKYLLGETAVNPAHAMVAQLLKLEQIGATIAGIPCNTAHAPAIFEVICDELAAGGSQLTLLHMIAEVGKFLQQHYPDIQRVGVLSTTGTAVTRIYPLSLEPMGFNVIIPSESLQKNQIHPAIYDQDFGIKAHGGSTPKARQALLQGVKYLQQAGAQALILGCTEIPMAIPEAMLMDMIVIDPATILARALIQAVDPQKLRPWPSLAS